MGNKQRYLKYEIIEGYSKKVGDLMKNKNKYQNNDKVRLKLTGETVTINKFSYVPNMKRYSYTLKEYVNTFYFEEEIEKIAN